MTTPWPLGIAGRPGGSRRLHRLILTRRLRRLSRQFAEVGVQLSPDRLAEIAAGSPASADELIDVAFAEAALRLRAEQRRAQRGCAKRRCVKSVVVLGAIVLALAVVLCLGLVFLTAVHTRGL